jgi:hypothetical protein
MAMNSGITLKQTHNSKSVNVYDEHARKITLNTALGTKNFEAIKLTQKVNERNEQSQAKKNGMRIN